MNIVWGTASTGSYGGTVFPGGIRYSLVNNVCGVQYSLGYRIHSDTGPRVPGPVFIVTRFLLPVCLSSALTSFLSPRKFSFPYFAYFSAVKWLGLSFTSASGTVPHPQFLNLSLLWSAVSAARRVLSLSAPSPVFLLPR